MNLLLYLSLLQGIAALPTTRSDPTPGFTFDSVISSGGACPNGSVSTLVKNNNVSTGIFRIIHTLDAFSPWIQSDGTTKEDCKLTTNIGVPVGYRARANIDGIVVKGYLKIQDAETSVRFSGQYSFTSDPSVVSETSLVIKGPLDGRFTKIVEAQGRTALSSCTGDNFRTEYSISAINFGSGHTQYSGVQGSTEDLKWVIDSKIEILKC
ncbi:hypothetical protein B0J11DRAFT_578448 [Dendryphion nanum]|uniref:Secreted protein n=1 Tax=Dendryphion nanum TaxID=256645 RepID=A0A9P9DYP9_9PLEO|nr:hypothetical protein B0J11DRAFT_578448 [Dendryphion nanum]